jgi:tRNA modification GTPase
LSGGAEIVYARAMSLPARPPGAAPAPDTIAAIATPAGRGGIGVVRVSGPRAALIARIVTAVDPVPRMATLATFRDASGAPIDEGLALLFVAPHSYTGEEVLELQGHGGPAVMRLLLRECLAQGARLAEPGEFTRRAFLNGRIDLAQAESVADLIEAESAEAARGAARSLTGEFSARVHALTAALVDLRAHVEACIDFPEEEIDPADRAAQAAKLLAIGSQLDSLQVEAKQGAVLRDGLTVVLVGAPNVGKSSLLNRLAGEDIAIVTAIPGTTRDHVRATLSLEGVPIHLIDTAGLRESGDEVERIGIARTWTAIGNAGAVLVISEAGAGLGEQEREIERRLPERLPRVHVLNKIDLGTMPEGRVEAPDGARIAVSAKTGAGIGALRGWLLEVAGWQPHGEGLFLARGRHLEALAAAQVHLGHARQPQAFELFAEDLRLAQQDLARITGEFTADALLGEIFGRFCIGK